MTKVYTFIDTVPILQNRLYNLYALHRVRNVINVENKLFRTAVF